MNKVIELGNLTRDVEIKHTATTAIAKFTLAINDGYGDKQYTSYIDVKCFGKQAENAAKYLSKGSKVIVDGKLKQERWEKDGQKCSRVVIEAFKVEYLDPPKGKKEVDDSETPF
jgi:single-strand DNA-binding protein